MWCLSLVSGNFLCFLSLVGSDLMWCLSLLGGDFAWFLSLFCGDLMWFLSLLGGGGSSGPIQWSPHLRGGSPGNQRRSYTDSRDNSETPQVSGNVEREKEAGRRGPLL